MTTSNYKQRMRTLLKPYLHHPDVRSMQTFVQHGSTSTFAHVYHVTALSFYLNERFHLHANEKHLAAGALLHDFYLYDWHEAPISLHSFRHPTIAAKNAKAVFSVDDEVTHIIEAHMWPLTLRTPPTTKEAAIVCAADKICAVKETLYEWRSTLKRLWRTWAYNVI